MICRRLVPSALATHKVSPADPPARTNVIMCPSGDQRRPTNSSSSFLGAPGRGAGISHVSKGEVVPRIRAMTATRVPSGEMSIPPMPVPGVTSRPVDAVRFAGSPPATNLTQTSVGPRAFDKYATHFPSGEMAGAHSRAGPLVSRTIREKDGPVRLNTVRDPIHVPIKAATSAVTSEPATNAAMDTLVRLAADRWCDDLCRGVAHCIFDLNPRVGDVVESSPNVFFEAPAQQPADHRWSVGSAVQSGSRSTIAARVSVSVSRANAARPVSIS